MSGTNAGNQPNSKSYVNCIQYVFLMISGWLTRTGLQGRNVLVSPKEILRIVLGLDLSQAVPSFAIGLRNPFRLVSAHEIDVDTGSHPRTQVRKQTPGP